MLFNRKDAKIKRKGRKEKYKQRIYRKFNIKIESETSYRVNSQQIQIYYRSDKFSSCEFVSRYGVVSKLNLN